MKKNICFVAGKSGGHIIPCITLAKQCKNTIIFFSTDAVLDQSILKQPLIIKHIMLPLGTLQYNRIYHYPMFFVKIVISFYKSIRSLHTYKPKKVISTGGLVSLPVCIAAKLLCIPIELYELNAIPGKTTKIIARFAHKIFVCFEQAKTFFSAKKCTYTPYPIRFFKNDICITQQKARKKLALNPNKKTIFVLGGSQGSVFLNNLVKKIIKYAKNNDIQIIHQTGTNDTTNWQLFYKSKSIPAFIFNYNEKLAHCYAAADLVICRSGAGTLFELIFFNKKCITIPLETKSTNHQLDNAQAMVKKYPHLFTLLRQNTLILNTELLVEMIKRNISALHHS